MSDWQPAIAVNVHNTSLDDVAYPLFGHKIRVKQHEPGLAVLRYRTEFDYKCDANKREYVAVHPDDCKVHGVFAGGTVVFCKHEILTD
jgi:hypothetical protein